MQPNDQERQQRLQRRHERTVTLYDNAGNKLKSWHGKIDLESNDQEVFFDLNGKRVIIQGGIVVSEED